MRAPLCQRETKKEKLEREQRERKNYENNLIFSMILLISYYKNNDT